MADNTQGTTSPSLNILAQYIKDFSFENPGAPRSLQARDKAPAININVNVNANPLSSVRRGEIMGKSLGMAVQVWNDEGRAVIGEKGELVCAKAFPSMPVMFWTRLSTPRRGRSSTSCWPISSSTGTATDRPCAPTTT